MAQVAVDAIYELRRLNDAIDALDNRIDGQLQLSLYAAIQDLLLSRMTDANDAKLIEAGRKLFARDWQFIWASPSIQTLPPMAGLEIAFAGRSNVGKSSLINALTGRNALARTSHTPGRTQELIFFEVPGKSDLRLVDMTPRVTRERAPAR